MSAHTSLIEQRTTRELAAARSSSVVVVVDEYDDVESSFRLRVLAVDGSIGGGKHTRTQVSELCSLE